MHVLAAVLLIGQLGCSAESLADDLAPLLRQPVAKAVAKKPVARSAYSAARARAIADGVPLVVLVSEPWCQPCQRLKKTIAGWPNRRDMVFVTISSTHDVAAKIMTGKTIPQLVAYRGPDLTGRKGIIGYTGQSEHDLLVSLGVSTPTQRPNAATARTPSAPWLSVNGSDPGAVHEVTITGQPALVAPNTEQAWRRHVAEYHGVAAAWSMTPQQLAQAHANSHKRGTAPRPQLPLDSDLGIGGYSQVIPSSRPQHDRGGLFSRRRARQ